MPDKNAKKNNNSNKNKKSKNDNSDEDKARLDSLIDAGSSASVE